MVSSDFINYAIAAITEAYYDDDDELKKEVVDGVNFHNEYDSYEEVTINIWLHKGTHHFIQC